jgi:cell division ATPase FtsA
LHGWWWQEDVLARHERYVVGLDIGTSKVCTVVGELGEEGGVDVIGLGVSESKRSNRSSGRSKKPS